MTRLVLTLTIMIILTKYASAQKIRLEGDNSRYLCLNDSVTQTFKQALKKAKVDSTIIIFYDFDNGRLPNSKSAIIWTHNGTTNIRIVEGCDKIKKDTVLKANLAELWLYIGKTHFDDITVPIKSGTGQSHDKYYHITVTTPNKSFLVVVRDNQRVSTQRHRSPESDSRVMLSNKIDALIK